jgi:hypothetical protein
MTEAFFEAQQQAALLSEAIDLALGIRHLTIVTGDVETAEDAALVEQLSAAARRGHAKARMRTCRAGNDYLTFYVEPVAGQDAPSAADDFVESLAALAEHLNPGSWRITRSPHYIL